jgi:hypothetical protein
VADGEPVVGTVSDSGDGPQSGKDERGLQMNEKPNDALQKLKEILESLEETKFHGSVVIHYASGKPKKIEYKKVEDIN